MSWCWLTGHKWKIISFFNYIEVTSCKEGESGVESNCLTLQCEKCGNVTMRNNWGGGFIKEPQRERCEDNCSHMWAWYPDNKSYCINCRSIKKNNEGEYENTNL